MTTIAERAERLTRRMDEWAAWPRDTAERYRIVKLKDFPEGLFPVAVASTPTKEGIGVCLVQLAEDGELAGEAVGVLDTDKDGLGWIVNPWGRGRDF